MIFLDVAENKTFSSDDKTQCMEHHEGMNILTKLRIRCKRYTNRQFIIKMFSMALKI